MEEVIKEKKLKWEAFEPQLGTWARHIKERDDYTCQNCNQHGGELRAHHINNFAEKEELRFSLDNGIIFCKDCHVEFHSLYGNRNNTKEQLLEFLGN